MTHDPESVIHLLRDHLAAHDKRLTFLFGAGTSSAVNIAPPPSAGSKPSHEPLIPAIDSLTSKCGAAATGLSSAHAAAWRALVEECEQLQLVANIESILGRLRLKADAAGPSEQTLGLDRPQLTALEDIIRQTIASLASPSEDSIPESVPQDEFAKWVKRARRHYPVEIFTTNYDVLFERSLERERTPFFDGFVGSYRPYFSPDSIDIESSVPGRNWARLWKLHGSTNWSLTDGVATRLSTTGLGDMIMPSQRKYDESRKMPYLALMDRFATRLSSEGNLLVTCGYSWGDEHINSTILTALDTYTGNAAVALSYVELDEAPHLTALAERRNNLTVIAPREGIIRGERRSWALPQLISKATASFVDISFDSDALPDSDGKAITGRMRLGDFNVFCSFLATMNREDRGI